MTVDLHVAAVQLVLIPTVLISALVHLVDDVKLAVSSLRGLHGMVFSLSKNTLAATWS
jgi:hypothetical protein